MSNRKIMIMPGDGIGPEVMDATMKVADWLAKYRSFSFDTMHGLCGGVSYEKYGEPITDETMADVMACDAVLFGAAGDHRYDNLPFELKPERGLLRMRKELDLYANLRPALVFPPLVASSTLKEEVISGLDIMIVRELTGGTYFAEPRGREERDGVVCAYDTNLYSVPEIERIGRVAFDLARKRNQKITSVEKANVMHSGVLWRETMTALHAAEGQELDYENMYADNCAMQLVRQPKQFDVIVTDNLFGDLLSDCAAMLTGSLGMLPSASLGDVDPDTGVRRSFYEPVHGSAPDIAGKGIANPIGQIWAGAMMLEHLGHKDAADDIVRAISDTLPEPALRTCDLGGTANTIACGRAIAERLE